MEKKMTKIEKINYIMTIAGVKDDKIAMEYFNRELELLSKDRKKDSKKEQEKAELKSKNKEIILRILKESDKAMTATEITRKFDDFITTQRVVSVLSDLRNDNKIERTMVKGTPYFSLKEVNENGEKN